MFNSKASKFFILSIAGAFSLLIGSSAIAQSNAANKAPNQLASQDPAKDQIYGWQVMSDAEREAYKKIQQEQRVSSTVKKSQDDEMIGIGHILLIITIVLAIFGGMFFGAVSLGLIHR